jgi:MFS family permease
MTATSFCADVGYEMVTAVLPGFLNTIGVAAAALGWIEGLADAGSSFVKLGAGWYSDRIGHRKGIVGLGYFISGTALALFALAVSWPLILLGRLIAWFGKGIRGPIRDALLSESIQPEHRGKAFGFHRAGDTLGAVLGPLLGAGLLLVLPAPHPSTPFRYLFVLSLIPGLVAVGVFAITVRETRRVPRPELSLWHSVRGLPAPYLRFLIGVGLFGMGDFSHALLIMAAAQMLAPTHGLVRAAQIAALLYVLRNAFYAGASFPIGAVADRVGKRKLLALGYLLGVLTSLVVAWMFASGVSGVWALGVVFALAGIYIAAEDAMEGAIPADMTSERARGSAYGIMGAVNGMGDLTASVLVGTLWTLVSPAAGFGAAALLMLSGAIVVAADRPLHPTLT